ncbi:MAG: TIGR02302 family protein [Alphaproteobacteria bacterium]|nr:TIGR02302 family protein [Alphaproteobacteria bacterium]
MPTDKWLSDRDIGVLRRRIGRRATLARLAIFAERFAQAFAPLLLVAAGFVGLALLDVLPALPGWAHGLALLLFGAAFLWAALRLKTLTPLPTRTEAIRRMERENGVRHAPLTTLTDQVAGNAGAQAGSTMWRAHLARLAGSVRDIALPRPAPGLAARDRFGVGAAVGLFLVIGLVVGGHEAGPRLASALQPSLGLASQDGPVRIDAWIDPPGYTGFAPSVLAAGEAIALPDALSVPAGSQLVARVVGLDETVTATLTPQGERLAFDETGPETRQLEATVAVGDVITFETGDGVIGSWPIRVIPDAAPVPELTGEIEQTARAAMRIPFAVTDDYGVTEVELVISRPGSGEEPYRAKLPAGPEAVEEGAKVAGTAFRDLTAHPWAGLEAVLEIHGTDALGQVGRSAPLTLVLPERVFTHPVAKEIIAARKKLAESRDNVDAVADDIRDIASAPSRYAEDLVVFLALKVAHSRLRFHPDGEENPSVMRMLWETALRLEDGDVTLTAEQLRELEQRIMEGLAEGQDTAEIDSMLDELQNMVDDMLRALSEDARKKAETQDGEYQDIDPQQMVSRDQLREMIEQIRELMKSGNRDAARQLMAELQQMMENLQAGMPNQLDPRQRQAWEAMRELSDLARQQQSLLDDTFSQAHNQRESDRSQNRNGSRQQGQRGQDGQQGQGQGGQGQQETMEQALQRLAQTQEALRKALADVMRRLGENGDIPRSLGDADQAMRDAQQALGNGQPGQAVDPQGRALEGLRNGAQEALDQLGGQAQALNQGDQRGQGQANQPDGEDPFGRRYGDGRAQSGEETGIPGEAAVKRAREILRELRERSADPTRTYQERDYLERLLERF